MMSKIRKESSDWTYKLIASSMVMIIAIIGIILILNAPLFGDFADEVFWLGIVLVMFSPVGVAANILLYKGRI